MPANRLDQASVELVLDYLQELVEHGKLDDPDVIGAMNLLRQQVRGQGRSVMLTRLEQVDVYLLRDEGSEREQLLHRYVGGVDGASITVSGVR